jgi:DUF4097 and DUF4098 domain-containing protein YvlB
MRTTTNTFVLALVALFVLLISFGCADISVNPTADVTGPGNIVNTKVKAKETFSYKVDLSGQLTLKVEGINGEVNVQSASGTNQITISGEKIVSADTYSEANESLKNVQVEIDKFSNELVVKTVQPKFSDGKSYNVNYTICVPSNLNVVVENVNGSINGKLSVPLNGTVDMRSTNGSIELEIPQNTSADFSASLANGTISIQNLTLQNRVGTSKTLQGTFGNGDGTISLITTNGNIDVLGF